MKTREEQLQEWRERRGITRPALKPKTTNPLAMSMPNFSLDAIKAEGRPADEEHADAPAAKKPKQEVAGDADHQDKENQENPNVPAPQPAADMQAVPDPATDSGDAEDETSKPQQQPARKADNRVPNFMAPTKSSKRHTRVEPGTGFTKVPTAKVPRDSLTALGLQEQAGFGTAGNLLRERMSILRRDSAAPGESSANPSRWSMADMDIGAPEEGKVPCLQTLAQHLFQQADFLQQCDKALNWQLKSSKDGATKDSRIAELAELTKLARRLLKQVLTSNAQFVNTALSAQRQLEQQMEGLGLQQMSAKSAQEALKAEMARAHAELAQAENIHKQEIVDMKLEQEKLEAEVKRLGRTIDRLETEHEDARKAAAEAQEVARKASEVKAQAEVRLEDAMRQREQSLYAATAARDVEVAATTRAREVEAAASDAIKRATEAESKCAIAEAASQAAEIRAEAAKGALQAKEQELETLQLEHASVIENNMAVLKDFEELQTTCNNTLADLNLKAASLESVTAQLAEEETKSQELSVQVSSLKIELRQESEKGVKMRSDIDVKASSIDRMAKQLAQQMDRCGSLEAQVNKLQEDIKTAASREASLTDEKQKLEEHLQGSSSVHQAVQEELRTKLAELEASKQQVEQSMAELVTTRDGLQTELAQAREDQSAKQRALEEVQADLESEQASVSRVKAEAEEKSERLAHLEGEMDALREVAGIAAEGGKEGDMVSALLSRVAALESAAMEAHKERRKLHNALVDLRGNIRVFCRVRPLEPHLPSAVAVEGGAIKVVPSRSTGKPASFTFDRVFTTGTTQSHIFSEVSELVQSALDGYNVCLFSYGQTGAGKTYTMQGADTPEGRGIIPRAVAQLLDAIHKLRAQGWEYTLEASFVEIYNEHIRDLLASPGGPAPPAGGLSVQHASASASGHTTVLGSMRMPVGSVEEADELVVRAGRARAVEATAMNATSSRSHSVFMLYCSGSNTEAGVRLTGALNLVDLAGSERLNRSKVEGARQKEACAINKSLSALGDVFTALSSKASHIPYRNSKLTHLLQPCLGGDGKTLMFVNINPEEASADESLCSLKFASQVSQCETSAKGGAKRNISTLPDAPSDAASGHKQPLGPSQRGENLGARRNSLAINGHSKPPFKRKPLAK